MNFPKIQQLKSCLNWGQLSRFAIIGVANTGIDFCIFFALMHWAEISPAIANLVSYSLSAGNSFLLNRAWTFGGTSFRDKLAYQVSMFALANAVGLALSSALLALALLLLPPLAAKAFSVVGTVSWNYWFNKTLVYRHDTAGSPGAF